ncbi:hypothetical protein [Corallococcus sicarius]
MGPSCYIIGSHCAPWESYPHSTSSCSQWPCTPGAACTAASGCPGVCVYTSPSGAQSGSPVACVEDPQAACCPGQQPSCGNTCCGEGEVCAAGACKPACGSLPYEPANQCCVDENIRPKFQIEDLSHCPDRVARPGWDPADPSHINGCGPDGSPDIFPDFYGSVEFGPTCNLHDSCYGTCLSDRLDCDDKFAKRLEASCRDVYPGVLMTRQRNRCLRLASSFALGVSVGGSGAYGAAQKKACICCQ